MEDDRGRSGDGLNLTASLEGPHNEAALHYSFMPNKQIVSFFICSHCRRFPPPSPLPSLGLIIRACLGANYLPAETVKSARLRELCFSSFVKIAINHIKLNYEESSQSRRLLLPPA